jgi:hypothetical protein
MPTPTLTADPIPTGTDWGWLKFWKKGSPIVEAPEPEPQEPKLTASDDPETDAKFIFGAPNAWGIDPDTYLACEKETSERRYERIMKTPPDWMGKRNLPGLEPREYVFDEPEGHKPLAPKSALYIPRPLTKSESDAVALMDLFEGITPKAALKKKLADLKKGNRRVVFDANGKMKEVKNGAK